MWSTGVLWLSFALVHPNRSSAWTVCGEQYCTQAPRGERLNVMAALFSDGSVMHSSHWCSTTAELFLGFVTKLVKTVTKALVTLIDNASIHRARAIQPAGGKGHHVEVLVALQRRAQPRREVVVADEAALDGAHPSHQGRTGTDGEPHPDQLR